MSAYIGGERLTFAERQARYVVPKLKTLPVIGGDNWRNQCYCGFVGRVRYRGRTYCPQCGCRLPLAATPEGTQHE